jgi:hypothetical protein
VLFFLALRGVGFVYFLCTWVAPLALSIIYLTLSKKKNIIVMDWCCMCKNSGESIDHILLRCEVAIEIWNKVFQLFGVMRVMPGRLKDCLGSWRVQKGNSIVIQI